MRKVRQVLPHYRIIANLRAAESDPMQSAGDRHVLIDERRDWEGRVRKLAAKAYRKHHGEPEEQPIVVMFAAVRARRAVEFYISEKAHEAGLPYLRKMLKAILKLLTSDARSTIKRFCELAGTTSDGVPPFAQMRALYCYGDPNSNGLGSESIEVIKSECAREKFWATNLAPSVILQRITKDKISIDAALGEWLRLASQLIKMIGKGRPQIAAETNFVAALAQYWRYELKAVLGNSRAENIDRAQTRRQRGLFADFVRTSAKMISPKWRPAAGWDHAIRSVVEHGR